ncbi:MAG TPA: hypothetical protein VMV41_13380, partial [Cellulomonadaceae bacterium]|nr:hypothetical protein [Cellulomonadaceae bacterium]
DAATVDPGSHMVAPGTNSFEKWLAVKVDLADGHTYSDFYLELSTVSGALPSGVTIKVGTTATAATPTAATSTVAKTTLAAGRRYTFDTSVLAAANDRTAYLVIQEVVAATAASGAIPQQALTVGWARD